VEDHYAPAGPHAGEFAPGAIVSSLQKKMKLPLASLFGREHVLLYLAGLQSWPDGLHAVKSIFQLIQNHYRRIITPYVVLPKDGSAAEPGVGVLVDAEGQFAQHYAASVLYLVRPDGYIAFRCLAAKQNLLQSYIDKYFVPL